VNPCDDLCESVALIEEFGGELSLLGFRIDEFMQSS
jgi:hypothetical protein